MKTAWLQGLEPDRIKELKGDFISSQFVRKRLSEIINDKIDTNRVSVRSKDNYDKPNFGIIVADSIGYERALAEVLSLLEPS